MVSNFNYIHDKFTTRIITREDDLYIMVNVGVINVCIYLGYLFINGVNIDQTLFVIVKFSKI